MPESVLMEAFTVTASVFGINERPPHCFRNKARAEHYPDNDPSDDIEYEKW
ncbi:hypothetical protein QRD25_24070 (plasmid) [Serratia marcescens]|nr:hypothetical protein QRD25_24070 [Serratia marcescens]